MSIGIFCLIKKEFFDENILDSRMLVKIIFIIACMGLFFLFLPVNINVVLDWRGQDKNIAIGVSWLGKLVGFIVENLKRCRIIYVLLLRRQFKLLELKRKPKVLVKEVKEKEKKPKKVFFKKLRRIVKPTIAPFSKFLKRLLRAIKLEHFALDAEYGTGNPATTGKIYGWSWALQPLLTEKMKLSLRPNFNDTVFKGAISLELKVIVYYFLVIITLFAAKFGLIWFRNK